MTEFLRRNLRPNNRIRSLAPGVCAERWNFYVNEVKPVFSYMRYKKNACRSRIDNLSSKYGAISMIQNSHDESGLKSNNENYMYKDMQPTKRLERVDELVKEAFSRVKDININIEKNDTKLFVGGVKNIIEEPKISKNNHNLELKEFSEKLDSPRHLNKAITPHMEYRALFEKYQSERNNIKRKITHEKRKVNKTNINEDANFILPKIKDDNNEFKGRYERIIKRMTNNEQLPIIKPILRMEKNKRIFGNKRKSNQEANRKYEAIDKPKKADRIFELCHSINMMLGKPKLIVNNI